MYIYVCICMYIHTCTCTYIYRHVYRCVDGNGYIRYLDGYISVPTFGKPNNNQQLWGWLKSHERVRRIVYGVGFIALKTVNMAMLKRQVCVNKFGLVKIVGNIVAWL